MHALQDHPGRAADLTQYPASTDQKGYIMLQHPAAGLACSTCRGRRSDQAQEGDLIA